jgi:hypothetical protein
MELLTTAVLGIVSIAIGVGLLIYGIRGRRQSQARDARTYKRGRI